MTQKNNRHTSDYQHTASTRYLTRILVYLEEMPLQSISHINKDLGLAAQKTRDAINWLVSHKLIIQCKDRGNGDVKLYTVNPAYLKIYNENRNNKLKS